LEGCEVEMTELKTLEEQFEEAIKKALTESAEVREVFILDELKDRFDFDSNTGIATLKQNCRLRLAEIEDYKQVVKDTIKKAHQEAHLCNAIKEVHDWIDWIEKELGL